VLNMLEVGEEEGLSRGRCSYRFSNMYLGADDQHPNLVGHDKRIGALTLLASFELRYSNPASPQELKPLS
jgi:hypothetical protein